MLREADSIYWHVLQTLPRQEKILAHTLEALGIDHYLPLRTQVKYYGRRKLSAQLPLFPSYVFLHGTLEQAYLADRTKRVVQVIKVADQGRIAWELGNVRLALDGHARLDPYPYLAKGVRVEVTSGPFRGLQGMVEERLRPDRLVLQIETLGQAVSLEIHGSQVEPIG